MTKAYITFEHWRGADGLHYARLRIRATMIPIGHGYPAHADCMGAIRRMVETNADTPITLLAEPPEETAPKGRS